LKDQANRLGVKTTLTYEAIGDKSLKEEEK
jgi:hypothetical protein